MSPAVGSEPVTGTVLWFKAQKGYGFVKPDDDGADVFLHVADLAESGISTVSEGDRISFRRATHGDGRFYAVNIGKIALAD